MVLSYIFGIKADPPRAGVYQIEISKVIWLQCWLCWNSNLSTLNLFELPRDTEASSWGRYCAGSPPRIQGSCFYRSFSTGGLLVACNQGKPDLKIGWGFLIRGGKHRTETYWFKIFLGFESVVLKLTVGVPEYEHWYEVFATPGKWWACRSSYGPRACLFHSTESSCPHR